MTDRPKGFVLTPSRLGKPPNTEEASAAKPVFTGDVNNFPNTVLEKDALGQYANPLHAENKSLLYYKMVIFIVFVYSLRRLSDKIGNLYSAVR
jgi:hypothetical protein